MIRVTRAFLFLIFAAVLSFAVIGQTSWTPELQVKVRALGTPRISPDGKRIVYTVNEAVTTADKSEFVTQVWIARTDGTGAYQMTFGEKSSANPRWSPDGNWIAFTSNRKDNKNNIYVLPASGGEAEQLTDVKSAVGDFKWSPDGRSIAYSAGDPKSDDEEKNDKGRNDFRFVNENSKFSRVYVVPLAKDAAGKREPKKLTGEDRHVTGFNWSPDGRNIVFGHMKTPVANDWPTSDVSLVEVASGKASPLAATPAPEGAPEYSPDGKWIALEIGEMPARWAQASTIHIVPASGGTPKALAASFDEQPNITGWSPDSKFIYFTEDKGTVNRLYKVDVAKNAVSEIDTGSGVVSAVSQSPDGKMLAYVWQSSDKAPEVYVRVGDAAPLQVSRANADRASLPMGRTEAIRWKASDGKEVEGLLTYPVGYTPGTRVPLLLSIHGGPTGVYQQTYIGGRGAYPYAMFASKGYAILRPNPRGSSGYGKAFRYANIKDWGFGDYDDIMKGVDRVIEMGVADPERLGVMGWSYGGYMTSTIITKTKRFKAASAGAPVTNLMSFNGTADIPGFIPDYFGGEFWDNPEVYAKHSAMFNIKGAVTPTLIQHGEADIRVPISQGYELYNALRAQGVPTRMIVLPRQPHGPNEPKMQIAAMQSNLEWFEKYLMGK